MSEVIMGLFFESDEFKSSVANLSKVIQHIKGNECCAFISAYLSFGRVKDIRGMEKYEGRDVLSDFLDQNKQIKETYRNKGVECPVEDLSNADKKRILDAFNKKQNKALNTELRKASIGFVDLEGFWGGVSERSKLVIKPDTEDLKDFQDIIVSLAEKFYQKAVLFTEVEKDDLTVISYDLDSNEKDVLGDFHVLKEGDEQLKVVLKNGFSRIWRHRGKGFYFGGIDEKNLFPQAESRFSSAIRYGMLCKTLRFRIYEQACNYVTGNANDHNVRLPKFIGKKWK
jgi:hypothetical protein